MKQKVDNLGQNYTKFLILITTGHVEFTYSNHNCWIDILELAGSKRGECKGFDLGLSSRCCFWWSESEHFSTWSENPFAVEKHRQTWWGRGVDPVEDSIDVVSLWTKRPLQPASQVLLSFFFLVTQAELISQWGVQFFFSCIFQSFTSHIRFFWLYLLPFLPPPPPLPLL